MTGAETCELVLALDAIGDRDRALALFGDIQQLRDRDGAYWTGWQFANQAHFPAERSSWTAAAMILAADALAEPPWRGLPWRARPAGRVCSATPQPGRGRCPQLTRPSAAAR